MFGWRLAVYDAFEGTYYHLEGEYPDESAVQQAATKRLRYLEETQPSKESGGQGEDEAIQDRVFIVRPDGTRYRYLPVN